MKHTKYDLAQMQSVPLAGKILMTQRRIREWVDEFGTDGVFVSFSGGKGSTVLLHIVREMYPDIEAVFVDTGLEYPEIRQFVKTFDNVTILRPKMRFDEVIKKYGYPIISKEVSLCIRYARQGSKWAWNDLNGIDKNGKEHTFKKGMYGKYKPLVEVDFKISNQCCGIMKEKPLRQKEKEKSLLWVLWQAKANAERVLGYKMVVTLLMLKILGLHRCHFGRSKMFISISKSTIYRFVQFMVILSTLTAPTKCV